MRVRVYYRDRAAQNFIVPIDINAADFAVIAARFGYVAQVVFP